VKPVLAALVAALALVLPANAQEPEKPADPATPSPVIASPAAPEQEKADPLKTDQKEQEHLPPPNFDAPPGMKPAPRGPLEDLKDQTTPTETPPTAEERNRVHLDNADQVREREADGVVIAEGHVRVRYNGYILTSDRATIDRKRRIVSFESNVVLDSGRQKVYADFVQVNTRTREFTTRGGRTVIPPDQIGQQILQPVYLAGETLKKVGQNFEAYNGIFTTCDFPRPHYKIGFRQANLLVNDRIVLRDAVIYRYDTPIARIPYLVVPIREASRFSYLPNAGRTNEEGYFLKAVVGYALSKTLPGLLRVDFMEKKGVGLGFDQAYRFSDTAAGTAAFYSLRDRNRGVNNLNGRINHQQRFGDILATLNSDFQNNSYNALTSNSKTQITTLTLNRTVGPSSTGLSFSLNESEYPTSNSRNFAYTLTQTQQIGSGTRTGTVTFRLNGSDNNSTSTYGETVTSSGRIEQIGDLKASGRLGAFDLDLQANRTLTSRATGTSASGSFFSGTERLPDFTLSTDSQRLGGFLRAVPTRLALGFGQFIENPGGITTRRLLFDANATPRPFKLTEGGWLSLTTTGQFRQAYYRDDAAQYILTSNTQLTQKFSSLSSFNLTYGYLRPYGGTPENFRLDQTGSNNNLGANLNISGERVRLTLLTGYDIQRARADLGANVPKNPWQNLTTQLALRPSGVFQTRFTSSYDINSGKLTDLTNRIRIRAGKGFALDTGLRYDPQQRKFPQITEVLQMPLFSRDLRFSALAGYNGVTRKFDYKNFGFILGFHDYEYAISIVDQPYGFRSEKGINFTIRLRALPATQQQQAGQFGTALDTGTGEVF
jgi:lipopolysaccharide assembly outer membrane protein LptD (OstA)